MKRQLKQIPDKQKFMEQLKPKFIERYKQLLGSEKEWQKFLDYSFSYLRKSIRVNTIKITIPKLIQRLEERWKLTPIPWSKQGFWIKYKVKNADEHERIDIGNLLEHQLGYFYVQEAASMIPPLVLGPKPGELVLDLCASPGSKTTQIAGLMKNTGIIVANDYKTMRLRPLGINIQRMGITNTIINQMYGQGFKEEKIQFDKVLVDAPCSGTGTIRKSLKTINIWNPGMVKRLSKTQKQLIVKGFQMLKPGGVMVYSTCTLEPEENESVVSHLLNEFSNAKLLEIKLDGLKQSKPIMEFKGKQFNKEVSKCLRIWPQDNDTEGFFVAKIKKSPTNL